MDLVSEREYQRLFEDYFIHVRAFSRGEKVKHRQTGEFESPDEELMSEVEKAIELKEKPDQFRKNLVTRIAAYSIEHPGQKIDMRALFADLFKALKVDVYKKREKQIETLLRDILKFGTDEFPSLIPSQKRAVKRSLARLKARHGYCLHCAKETVAYVLKHRLK
jgi:predicted Ser/Thr protein kinase